MNETVFTKDLREREDDQETKKAMNNLEAKNIPSRISLSLPADAKEKYLNYCKAHYTTPSAQLRAWIDQNCNDQLYCIILNTKICI